MFAARKSRRSAEPVSAPPSAPARARRLWALGLLLAGQGLIPLALARPNLPPEPAPQAEPLRPGLPEEAGPRDGPRGPWRNLSPEQREAIRQLSREQREALAARQGQRPGGPAGPAARMSPRERRELRALIREEHERRAAGRRRP